MRDLTIILKHGCPIMLENLEDILKPTDLLRSAMADHEGEPWVLEIRDNENFPVMAIWSNMIAGYAVSPEFEARPHIMEEDDPDWWKRG